ncbi:unnamed protein product [Nezara viridula]|uniref:Uncharacterized protein n=1 Tax=Nezara viridula TaxID=85310 RepID=A0A9P0HLB6_NEZVI|nr:unnamed protein product [Nezara viridula]
MLFLLERIPQDVQILTVEIITE